MFNIPIVPTINSYRDISFSQFRQIKGLSNNISRPAYDILKDAQQRQSTLNTWRGVIHRIDKTLKQKRTFARAFLDLITFQFIKRWVFASSISQIKKSFDTVISKTPLASAVGDTTDKLEMVQRAYTHFTSVRDIESPSNDGDETWVATAIEVNDYFDVVIRKLKASENVPLPNWYHATTNGLEAIAQGGVLKRGMSAYMGPGTYFSTRDEHNGDGHNYGEYTYAIDESLIYDKPGAYFYGSTHMKTHEEPAVWVRVESDVNVDGSSVAFIATPDTKTRDDLKDMFWRQWGQGFYAEVITRSASDWIRKSFTGAGHIYQLPTTWRRHERGGSIRHLNYVREP